MKRWYWKQCRHWQDCCVRAIWSVSYCFLKSICSIIYNFYDVYCNLNFFPYYLNRAPSLSSVTGLILFFQERSSCTCCKTLIFKIYCVRLFVLPMYLPNITRIIFHSKLSFLSFTETESGIRFIMPALRFPCKMAEII